MADHESTEERDPQTGDAAREAEDDVEAHAFRMSSDGDDEDAVEAHAWRAPSRD